MRMEMRTALIGITLLLSVTGMVSEGPAAFAQTRVLAHEHNQLWTSVAMVPDAVRALPTFVRPTRGHTVRIDLPALAAAFDEGPEEHSGLEPAVITLPMPDGSFEFYELVESSIMEPELAVQLPDFHTYAVRGLNDPTARGRLDWTSQGLRGFVRGERGAMFLDPYSAQNHEYVSSYWLHDYQGPNDWRCDFGPEHWPDGYVVPDISHHPGDTNHQGPFQPRGTSTLRTYRLAMACPGEYGVYHSTLAGHAPNSTDAMAAIVTVVNRTNVTFEADLAVRFVLVANNTGIAFFNPATDPYPDADPACLTDPAANCSGPYFNANTAAINNVIGSAAYDIGHVVTRVPGGVANTNSPCGNNKARASSGIPRGGDLDPVTALVVIHEIGHQFGALHTFNGVVGRCGGNHTPGSNWEPGSGTTEMSYPGGCPVGGGFTGDNIAVYADPYFNIGSVLQMRTFLAGTNSMCSGTITNSNAAPTITGITPSTHSIPMGTPFFLAAFASDADGNPLSYQWDELDLGPAISLLTLDNGDSSLFRSYAATASGARTFPKWADILGDVFTPGEMLPTFPNVTREFRVMVRDNALNGSGITISPVVGVNIAAAGPFTITAPAEGSTQTGSVQVQWNVAGTTLAPISSALVDISLTADNGATYVGLASATPNDGSQLVALPAIPLGSGLRILVAPTNNIYFAISRPFIGIAPCDSIDVNGDGVSPDSADVADFLSVFAGGTCSTGCTDIDFNNDGVSPDTADIEALLRVFGGGSC